MAPKGHCSWPTDTRRQRGAESRAEPSGTVTYLAGSERPCAFCERTGVKLSREHVFPQWLSKVSGAKSFTIHRNGKAVTTPLMEVVTRQVCEPCNNGWMKTLEDETAAVMTAMLEVSPGAYTIGDAERRTLARWLLKTLMTCQLAMVSRNEKGPFRPAHYPIFFNHPEPSANQVTLLSAFAGPAEAVRMQMLIPLQAGEGMPTYLFHFGRIVMWGFFCVETEFQLAADPELEQFAHVLWPKELFWDSGTPLPWPPAKLMDQNGLGQLWDITIKHLSGS